MRLSNLLEASVPTEAKRKAIQAGNFSKDIAFSVKKDLSNIVKKHIDTDWKVNSHFLDQGIQYKGEDEKSANKVVDAIIGDLYGYFVDIPRKLMTRVVKSTRDLNGTKQTVYTVSPKGSKEQIEFFKFNDKPEIGILISLIRK